MPASFLSPISKSFGHFKLVATFASKLFSAFTKLSPVSNGITLHSNLLRFGSR